MPANPALAVRVGANLEDLKKGLTESKAHIAATTTAFTSMTGATTQTTAELARTTNNFGRASEALGRFDALLGTAGVNLSSEIRGLRELSEASGKTVSELGAVGTAGLALGAGMAAWGITRAAMEFFELDKHVEKAWTRLLGFADLAAETAGAKMDVLAKASRIAGREITDFSEAMRINEEAARRHIASFTSSAQVVAGWQAEIAKVRAAGHLEQLRADLASQNFTLDELALRYGLSTRALQFFGREMKAAADDAKQLNADVKTLLETWAAGDKIMADFAKSTHEIAMKVAREQAAEQKRVLGERNQAVIDGLTQIKDVEAAARDFTMKQTLSTTDYQVAKIREWEAETIAAFKGSEQQLATYTTAVQARAQQQVEALKGASTEANVVLIGGAKQMGDAYVGEFGRAEGAGKQLFGTLVLGISNLEELNRELSKFYDQFGASAGVPMGAPMGGRRITGLGQRSDFERRLLGGQVGSFQHGGVGDFGSGTLAMLHGREAIVPLDRPGASVGAPSITNIYITQPLGTPEAIARVIDDVLMRRQRAIGARLPSGA